MSYANYFEISKCLSDSLAYCQEHPDREHSKFHGKLLKRAQDRLETARAKSDQEFTEWRMENREDMLAWKHLASELQKVQKRLSRVNAVGYLDQKVMYWYHDALISAVAEMIDYLKARTDDLDFAVDAIAKLERKQEKATSEVTESGRALDEYLRYSKMRADAMREVTDTIAGFRKRLRRDLGKQDEAYQAIRWPQQIASDQRVL